MEIAGRVFFEGWGLLGKVEELRAIMMEFGDYAFWGQLF